MADISKLNLTGSDLDIKDSIARQKLTVIDPTAGEGLITFGVDANGNYGYKKVGADTVTPFLTGGGGTLPDRVVHCNVNVNKTRMTNCVIPIDNVKEIYLSNPLGDSFAFWYDYCKLLTPNYTNSNGGVVGNTGSEFESYGLKDIQMPSGYTAKLSDIPSGANYIRLAMWGNYSTYTCNPANLRLVYN